MGVWLRFLRRMGASSRPLPLRGHPSWEDAPCFPRPWLLSVAGRSFQTLGHGPSGQLHCANICLGLDPSLQAPLRRLCLATGGEGEEPSSQPLWVGHPALSSWAPGATPPPPLPCWPFPGLLPRWGHFLPWRKKRLWVLRVLCSVTTPGSAGDPVWSQRGRGPSPLCWEDSRRPGLPLQPSCLWTGGWVLLGSMGGA